MVTTGNLVSISYLHTACLRTEGINLPPTFTRSCRKAGDYKSRWILLPVSLEELTHTGTAGKVMVLETLGDGFVLLVQHGALVARPSERLEESLHLPPVIVSQGAARRQICAIISKAHGRIQQLTCWHEVVFDIWIQP